MILSTEGGACVAGGRGMRGRGGVCGRGVCMVGGVRARERGCAWQGGLRDMHAPPGRYYGYCIGSMTGRYASYWNAYLLLVNFKC